MVKELNDHQLEALTYQLKQELNKKQNPFGDGEASDFEVEIVAAPEEAQGFILCSFDAYETGKLYLICEYEEEQFNYSLVTTTQLGNDKSNTGSELVDELEDGGTDWLEKLTPSIHEFLGIQVK